MLLAVKFAAIRAVIDYIDDKSLIFSVKMKNWFSKNNVERYKGCLSYPRERKIYFL